MVIYNNRNKSTLTSEQQVIKIALLKVRVKRHYEEIFQRYGKDKVFAVWQYIPTEKQSYITGVVQGNIKPVPDLEDITSQIIAAKDLEELQEIKAEVVADYGKPALIKAWEMIPEKEQKRITLMSHPRNSDSQNKAQPPAVASQSTDEEVKPEDLPDEWEPQPRKDRPVKPEPKTESIHERQSKEAAMDETQEAANPNLVQIWLAFTMAESDEEVNELMGQLEGKVDALKYVWDRLEVHRKSAIAAKEEAMKETEKIYSEPIKKIEVAQRQMENYLLWQRQKGNLPQDELVGDKAVIRFRKYESIGELQCEVKELPDEYRRVNVKVDPNKKALLEAHKSGQDISKYADINEKTKVQFTFKSLLKRKPKEEQPKTESKPEPQPVNGDSKPENYEEILNSPSAEGLKVLLKGQLVGLAQQNGLEVKPTESKEEIIIKLLVYADSLKQPEDKQPQQSENGSSSIKDKEQLEKPAEKPQDKEQDRKSLNKLRKPELIKLAENSGVELNGHETKARIIDKILAHSNQE